MKEVEASRGKLEGDVKKLNYEDGKEEMLSKRKKDLTSRVAKLKDQVMTFSTSDD